MMQDIEVQYAKQLEQELELYISSDNFSKIPKEHQDRMQAELRKIKAGLNPISAKVEVL